MNCAHLLVLLSLSVGFQALPAQEAAAETSRYVNICYANHERGDSMMLVMDARFKPIALVMKKMDLVFLIGDIAYDGPFENLSAGAYIEMDLSQTSITIKRTTYGLATRIINKGKVVDLDILEEAIRENDQGSFSAIFFSSTADLLDPKRFLAGQIDAPEIKRLVTKDNPRSSIVIRSDVTGLPKPVGADKTVP